MLWFQVGLVALLGLLVGGVVNALADDLPERRRPRLPHYPDGTPRPVSAWLGVLAFATGQRTSAGGSRLSWRYPLTELLTAFLFALTYERTTSFGHSPVERTFALIYMAIFALVTVIDIEHRLILFAVMIPAGLIALLDLALPITDNVLPVDGLLGGLLGFGVFYAFYLGGFLFNYVSGRVRGYQPTEVAFGYGDVMLATLCGLIINWRFLLFAMFITVFLGALGAVLYLIFRRLQQQRGGLSTPLPYGPYIVIGTIIMMLFANQVRDFLAG